MTGKLRFTVALAAFLTIPVTVVGQDRLEDLPPTDETYLPAIQSGGMIPPIYAEPASQFPNEQPPAVPLPFREAVETPQSPPTTSPGGMSGRGGGMGMMSGMGMMGGMGGPGASYKALWLPAQPVSGQDTNLAMVQEDFAFSVPLWRNGPDGVTFSAGARNELFQTGAVMPLTGEPFPDQLWNIRLGAGYNHRFDNGRIAGFNVHFGSASDKPFHSIHEATAMASGFLRLPVREHDAWLLSLNFSTNSQVMHNIPIPGVAYFYCPSETFQATVGFPFASINWRPSENLRFEMMYALLTTIHTRAIYETGPRLQWYAGFDWLNESYLLADREDDRDRFYYYEKRLSAGVRWKAWEHVAVDLSSGFAFDRYYFEGRDFSLTSSNRLNVGNSPFIALQVEAKY